jgi:hypothetical protein
MHTVRAGAIRCGRALVQHVFRYNSAPGVWGFNWLFVDSMAIGHVGAMLDSAQAMFLKNARFLIMLTIAGAALLARLRGGERWVEVSAFGLCVALVLAPGFGYQYLAWPLPLLFAIDVRRAVVTSLAGGVLIGAMYLHFWVGDFPATSLTSDWPRFGVVLGVITWLNLLAWSWRLARSISQPLAS